MLREFFPDGITLPKLQTIYEPILKKEFDRRNFRKKVLNLGLIYDTNKSKSFRGSKPAKIYKFKNVNENKSVF